MAEVAGDDLRKMKAQTCVRLGSSRLQRVLSLALAGTVLIYLLSSSDTATRVVTVIRTLRSSAASQSSLETSADVHPRTRPIQYAVGPHLIPDEPECTTDSPLFYDVALKHYTDKINGPHDGKHRQSHDYQRAYQQHLAALRCKRMNFMEIGLGCGMTWGPGRSVPLWTEYLPFANITIMEYDVPCAQEYAKKNPYGVPPSDWARMTFLTGDQSKPEDLQKVHASAGPFDVIVDDGGHTSNQQIVSLRTLLPLLKQGGVYFLEDLHMSWFPDWVDTPTGITAVDYVDQLIRCKHSPTHRKAMDHNKYPGVPELVDILSHIDCYQELCVFVK